MTEHVVAVWPDAPPTRYRASERSESGGRRHRRVEGTATSAQREGRLSMEHGKRLFPLSPSHAAGVGQRAGGAPGGNLVRDVDDTCRFW